MTNLLSKPHKITTMYLLHWINTENYFLYIIAILETVIYFFYRVIPSTESIGWPV